MKRSQKVVVNKQEHFGSKELPFEAPYSYFDHLPNRVWSKLEQKPQSAFWMRPVLRYSLSSLFIGLLGWWFWLGYQQPEAVTQSELNQLATADIAAYLLQHSDPQGMMLMAQTEPIAWDEILPGHVELQPEDALQWLDESEILEAWEEI